MAQHKTTEKQGMSLRKILDAVDDAIMVLDENFRVEDLNNTARLLLGAKKDFELSDFVQTFLSMEWRKLDENENPLRLALRKRQTIHFRGYLVLKPRKFLPVAISVIPFTPGLILIVRDITRDLAIEKELHNFVGIASHQLRTPLSSILWFLELLLSGTAGEVNKKQWELLLQSYNAAARLADMIRLLLDVSRIEIGAVAINPVSYDLVQLIRQEFFQMKIFAEKKQQTFELHLPQKEVMIPVDKIVLGFVLQNLLSNAIKYTPEKGTISVTLEEGKEEWIVSVRDSGYGIPEEAKPHIFQKFFRAENILTYTPEGTGLGLYVAKSLVELWGGKIWFESEEKKASTFWFTIPKEGFRKIAGRTSVERTQIPLY
ncbi:MAG: hypothetical protein A3A30_02385 [Candidatus Terrybacteria bacterium RIFCSPLOWO2_01_FULL_48_14]|nr:MAG: hypothetical protein A3A30_02385 [Candidatus Terrybacteria bacterium RIFCSPLOWO2_01_FULL_48_14]